MQSMSKTKVWIVMIAGVIVVGAAVLTTYQYTKSAYRAVGVNDGAIDANMQILERVTEFDGKISMCTSGQILKGKEIIAVKGEAIYAFAKSPDMILLCRAQ